MSQAASDASTEPPPAPPVVPVSRPSDGGDCSPQKTMSHYTSGVNCLLPQDNDDNIIFSGIPERNSPPPMKMASRTSGIYGRSGDRDRPLPKRMISRTSGVDLTKPSKVPKGPTTATSPTSSSRKSEEGGDDIGSSCSSQRSEEKRAKGE
jgi:hypothetical protein